MISWNRYCGCSFFLVIYTYAKKILAHIEKNHSPRTQIWNAIAISFVVGLYDGFIGPGTGSFWYFITLWDSIF
jgi:uncharacterized membrane protein YfcA